MIEKIILVQNNMQEFVYKSREEQKCMEHLASSSFISLEQLQDIKQYYDEGVPYHNFLHALQVAEGVLDLSPNDFNLIEIKSLFIAALFHDAGHKGTAESLDEFRSLDLAFENIQEFEKKYNYQGIDYSIVRKAIVGTVFKNRAKNKDRYAQILADFDVSAIGMSFAEFLYYSDFPIAVEFGVEIGKWIQDVNYFKFLMGVSKHIFLQRVVQDIYPEGLINIKNYLQCDSEAIKKLFYYWLEKDLTFAEFEIFYGSLKIGK